jgi:hypothetical protein
VAIAIALGNRDGLVAAACLVVVALTVRKHPFLSVFAAVLFVWLGHVRYIVVLDGAAYRLLWGTLIGAVFQVIRNRPPRLTRVVPRLRCGHGLQARIRAADEALQQRLGAAALDAYLAVLADHQLGGCDRALYLRAAEAAVLAGDARLAVELAGAAARDVQGEPVGQLATILARAGAIEARAHLLLGDVAGAAQAVRAAQSRTQANRSTDRYLRWAAADVYLAGRPIKSVGEVTDDLAAAIRRQQLTMRPSEVLGQFLLSAGWRALDSGLPEPALGLAVTAVEMTRLGGRLDQALVESGKRRIPRRRVTAWQLYRDAVLLQVAAAARIGSHDDAPRGDAVDRAISAATRLDDPWAAARLMFEDAQWSIRNGKADTAAALLRRALDLGDYRLHAFSDTIRQANWVTVRSRIAATLGEITGESGSYLVEAWPSAPAHWQRRQAAAAAALELFGRLRQRDPDVFTAAHGRVLASISNRPPVAVPETVPTNGPAQPQPVQVDQLPEAREGAPQATPARSEADPGPAWLRDVLASGPGERCWTVYQGYLLAQAMSHGHVGPEHLILVLLAERPIDGLIAEFTTSPADLRAAVAARFGAVGGTPDLDPRLEPLLAAAAAEAARWGERRIRPTRLMLAMLREPASAGMALLESYGVDRQELLVRLLAATVSWSPRARTPLFATDAIVGPYRLTTPARLALAGATDLAIAGSGLLDADHLRLAVQQYDWSARSPQTPVARDRSEEVKVTGSARTALRTALHLASGHGISGIGLDHLRLAVGVDERPHKEFSPTAQSVMRAAHRHAELHRRTYVQPADVRWAFEGNSIEGGPDACFGVPPVLTPQLERAIAAAERAAVGRVEADDLRTALAPMRAAR